MAQCMFLPNLEIENAQLMFRNFEGREKQFNNAGDRNVCVLLNDEIMQLIGEQAEKQGADPETWNVKYLKPREDDDDDTPKPYLTVHVKYDFRPPTVIMVDERSGQKTPLTEDTVGLLDTAEIVNADLVINPSCWNVNGKAGVKAYLKTLYVTIASDPFAAKYDLDPEDM